jgi:hypothetical protein
MAGRVTIGADNDANDAGVKAAKAAVGWREEGARSGSLSRETGTIPASDGHFEHSASVAYWSRLKVKLAVVVRRG